MSYEDFIEALDELYMSIEEVAEKLGLEVDEVKCLFNLMMKYQMQQ